MLSLKQTREKRNRHKSFLFEGVRLINAAIDVKWPIEAFVYSSSSQRPLSDWAKGILAQTTATIYDLSPNLLEQLSDKEETSELLAIGKIRADDVSIIPSVIPMTTATTVGDSGAGLIAVFDRPTNPGNLGTFIRTCDAFGVDAIIITGHACDLYDPQTIRATTGSFFSIPIVRLPSHTEFMALFTGTLQAANLNFQIIGTDERAPLVITDADFRKPTVILVGNETSGLSSAYKSLCTQLVKIPMAGSASSLNAAVAASLILYEAKRQRGFE